MSLYNEDELVAPSWINEDFLKTVLIKYENKQNVEIIKFDTSPASMKGDHYGSIMFRCKVSYRFETAASTLKKSLIIKTVPIEEGQKREMLMQTRLFETEIEMYTTLPKLEKILAECGEPTKLAADIFYHSLAPHKVLVLEDLCEAGYNAVRGRYLTEEEIKVVYSKIAKLHAVSYMLGHSNEHELVTKFQEGVFSTSAPLIEEILANRIRNFVELLSSHDEFAIYLEKIKLMEGHLLQACKELFQAYKLNNGKGDIFVLNHGDFHMKNLMFKFSKQNKIEDLTMVDYQASCYGPSTIDMVYSQYTMLSSELRLKRHQLMQYYFTEFTRILKKINCQGELPKYSEFQMAGLKYRHFSIFVIAAFLPKIAGVLSKPIEALKEIDTTKHFETPDMIAMTYNAPALVEDLRQLLPVLLSEGYLD